MDDIAIDVADAAKARGYARAYLSFVIASLGLLGFALWRNREFPIIGAIALAWIPLLLLYFRWRRIAHCLEDKRKAEMIACALNQKGADYERACEVLNAIFGAGRESAAVMANPTTWGRKQRFSSFTGHGLEVVVYERNGLVGDLKTFLR
jgi:hypothetical protein